MTELTPIIIGLTVIVIIGTILSKNFIKKYPQYNEKKEVINYVFIIPLLYPLFCLCLYYLNQTILTQMVMFVDSLYKPSTYTPFLGDLGNIIDIAEQNAWLPEIGTSPEVSKMAKTIATSNMFIGIGLLIIVILIGIVFYRTFHFDEYSKKSICFFHIAASIVLIVTIIIFVSKACEIYADAIWFAFLVMGAALAFITMKWYYNKLKQL